MATKIKTFNHTEDINEVFQMDSAMEQDLNDGIRVRAKEIMEEQGINEDDMIEYSTSIEVKIKIKYQKNRLINSYVGGKCPDCSTKIPKDAQDGDDCINCGHIFYVGWEPEQI